MPVENLVAISLLHHTLESSTRTFETNGLVDQKMMMYFPRRHLHLSVVVQHSGYQKQIATFCAAGNESKNWLTA